MAEGTENWRLILDAARALTAARQTPFTRISVYEWIWRCVPQASHGRQSLDPTFQGMVRNATGGPHSAGGTPLIRVGHGLFVLAKEATPDGEVLPDPAARPATPVRKVGSAPLTEDEVKRAVKEFLEADGFQVSVAWGHERGTDIEAVSASEILLLEAKGSAQNPAQQVNYFLGALGELLQRMKEPNATYGLALPDNYQYRGLVERLPALVWERLRFTVLFVSKPAPGTYTVDRVRSPLK